MKPLRRRIERIESSRPAREQNPAFAALIKSLNVAQLEELEKELYRQIPEELLEEVLAAHPHNREEIMRARGEPSDPALVKLLSDAGSSFDA